MRQESKEKLENQTIKYYNKIVFLTCNFIGTILAIYIGGWIMLLHSIWITYLAFMAGKLTLIKFLSAAFCVLFSTTVAGGIWSIGYMAGRKLERMV